MAEKLFFTGNIYTTQWVDIGNFFWERLSQRGFLNSNSRLAILFFTGFIF